MAKAVEPSVVAHPPLTAEPLGIDLTVVPFAHATVDRWISENPDWKLAVVTTATNVGPPPTVTTAE